MPGVPPTSRPGDRPAPIRLAFAAAVLSIVVAFMTVGSTIPLFNLYQEQDGFTNASIAWAVVAYSVATLGTLLAFGQLSDRLGRRPVAVASLLFLLAGCVVLLNVHHTEMLIVGRSLMGVGAAFASSGLTAYVVDTAPARPTWLASVASSQTVMLGLSIGALTSGALVQYGPWPRDLIFAVTIPLLVVSVGLVAASPETIDRRRVVSRQPGSRIYLPSRVRYLLPVAVAVLWPTWALGAFYQAFVPAVVASQLHTRSPFIVGVVFSAYMGMSAVGAPLGGLFTPDRSQRLGMVGLLIGVCGIVAAITSGILSLFIIATMVAGASQGIAISAVTRALLSGSRTSERAAIFGVIYLLCYSGATLPSLVAGQLSHVLALSQITLGYGALALVGTLVTTVGVSKRRSTPAATS